MKPRDKAVDVLNRRRATGTGRTGIGTRSSRLDVEDSGELKFDDRASGAWFLPAWC